MIKDPLISYLFKNCFISQTVDIIDENFQGLFMKFMREIINEEDHSESLHNTFILGLHR